MHINHYEHSYSTVDNGTRDGLDKFLKAASSEPETVLHYEFMQDYKVCAEKLFLFVVKLCVVRYFFVK